MTASPGRRPFAKSLVGTAWLRFCQFLWASRERDCRRRYQAVEPRKRLARMTLRKLFGHLVLPAVAVAVAAPIFWRPAHVSDLRRIADFQSSPPAGPTIAAGDFRLSSYANADRWPRAVYRLHRIARRLVAKPQTSRLVRVRRGTTASETGTASRFVDTSDKSGPRKAAQPRPRTLAPPA